MSASSVQAKVRNGLAKANKAVGSSSDVAIFLVTKTTTGNSPINPGIITEVETQLVNAIFKSFDKTISPGVRSGITSILAGDRMLVSDSSVVVKTGDIIRQGSRDYVIIDVDDKAPVSDTLAYISHIRLK